MQLVSSTASLFKKFNPINILCKEKKEITMLMIRKQTWLWDDNTDLITDTNGRAFISISAGEVANNCRTCASSCYYTETKAATPLSSSLHHSYDNAASSKSNTLLFQSRYYIYICYWRDLYSKILCDEKNMPSHSLSLSLPCF